MLSFTFTLVSMNRSHQLNSNRAVNQTTPGFNMLIVIHTLKGPPRVPLRQSRTCVARSGGGPPGGTPGGTGPRGCAGASRKYDFISAGDERG